MQVRAITFDFWNTLYADRHNGSADEARSERLDAVRDALGACGLSPSEDELRQAWLAGFDAYLEAWREGRHFGAFEQVRSVLARFKVVAPEEVVHAAATRIEESGARANLELTPGVVEAIPALAAAGIGLGLISDTGLTPGRVLVTFLERDGLLPYFSRLTFSDETGFPKPDPRMFQRTVEPLGVPLTEAAHVGDTPRTDIAGALALGMKAVRFAAAADHPEPPEADWVIHDHRELLALVGL